MIFFASLIYQFFKLVVVLITRIFYSKFTVINRDWLKFKNPAIVVSNHPSTLMDPLNVGVKIPKQISFLANASLFKNPILGAILNLYCIPIERPKDVGERRIQNENNFARADRYLAKGGCIYIAPEGTSEVERRVRRVKTGTARIALSAESKSDFKLGLTIIPTGLNYTAPLHFQSKVLLNVGQPIKVSDYQNAYDENPVLAAKKLTADLQTQMESLIFHTENDEQDELLGQIEKLLHSENPLPAEDTFFRTQKVLKQLKTINETEIKNFKTVADQYFKLLEKEKTNDLAVFKNIKNQSSIFSDWLKLIFGFPFFLYGWLNNFIAFFIPGFLAEKIKIFPGYRPAIMTLSGLILVPLVFYFQVKTVNGYIGFPYAGWIYFLTLLPMGWIAWQYRKFVLQYFKTSKVKKLSNTNPEIFDNIKMKREELLLKIREVL